MLTVPRITILGRLLRIGWGVVKADIRAVPGGYAALRRVSVEDDPRHRGEDHRDRGHHDDQLYGVIDSIHSGSMEPCRGDTGQSGAPFDAHAQFRIADHDRASINRTSTNSANRHVAMIGTDGETIPVEGFMDR